MSKYRILIIETGEFLLERKNMGSLYSPYEIGFYGIDKESCKIYETNDIKIAYKRVEHGDQQYRLFSDKKIDRLQFPEIFEIVGVPDE